MMPTALLEALASLSEIVDEENERLERPGYDPLLPELVATKVRLAGTIEAETVRLAGRAGDWRAALDPDERTAMTEAIAGSMARLAANGAKLQRRIALCDDLIGAIAREAERASGAVSATYGASGRLAATRRAAPISINSRF